MREITIPEDIQLVDPVTDKPVRKADEHGRPLDEPDEPLTFRKWVILRPLRDPKFAKNSEGQGDVEALYYAADLRKALKDARPGDRITIEETVWKRLDECVRKPSQPYDAGFMYQLIPFIDAITKAEKKESAKKEEN